MKVSGFTIIKDAVIYDYPIVEAIQSILPICDEVVVGLGKSNDDTLGLINRINSPKIKIFHSVWDETIREGGKILAIETNKAFQEINPNADWAFYIQGDEVLPEAYYNEVINQMKKYKSDDKTDGLLFKYLHFYGSYDYLGASSQWYKSEVRIIKNDKSIFSYKDAQGFRKGDNKKLTVRAINAYMYHYGWVKEPKSMQLKHENFNKYWHNDQWINDNVAKKELFDYNSNLNELRKFEGIHPSVMAERINRLNWKFDYDISYNNKSMKDRFKAFFNDKLGINMSYQNYKIL